MSKMSKGSTYIDGKMSRLSSMRMKTGDSTDSTPETAFEIDLKSFITSAINYLEHSDNNSLLQINASLKLISLGANVKYSDEELCAKYFEVITKLAKSDFPDIWTLYRALKAATCNGEGIQHMKNNLKLLEHLFSSIPKIENHDQLDHFSKKESEKIVEMLAILQQVTLDLTFTCFNISFRNVLENLAGIFTAFSTKPSEQTIACCALISIVNLCRANEDRISYIEVKALQGKKFLANLLLFSTPEKYEALLCDTNDEENMPAYTPLLVTHLLLLLENVSSPLPAGQLSQHIKWSFKALTWAIQRKRTTLILQAAEFLNDLLAKEHHRNVLFQVPEYNNKFEEVIDCLIDHGHVDPTCDVAIIKLLSSMLSIMPDDSQIPQNIELIRKAIALCTTYLVQFHNYLVEGEVGIHQVKLVEAVTLLSNDVLECVQDGTEYTGELNDILPYCVQTLTASANCEETEFADEDCGCLEATLKLLICMSKFVDLRAALRAVLTEELMDNLNKSFILQNKGKISNVIVSYLLLLSCIKEWTKNFSFMVTNDNICEHVAFVLKLGSPFATLQASKVVGVMPKQSCDHVMKVLEALPMYTTQYTQKNICIMSEGDYKRVDEVLSNLHQNNDSRSFQDSTHSALVDIVETYKLQVNDLQAQCGFLQENLRAANNLASRNMQVSNAALENQANMASKVLAAEKSRHDSVAHIHSISKKLKLSADANIKAKKDLDEMFERIHKKEAEIDVLKDDLDNHKKKLKQAEEKYNSALKKIGEFETKEAACEKKLASYKKDCTALNHKNGALAKECETLKAEKQVMIQEKNEAMKELQELKRIKEMVAQLTSGKK